VSAAELGPGHVLLLVENEPVPLDKRAWWECQVLVSAGLEVTVVCPQGAGEDRAPFERWDGVTIHRYPAAPQRPGMRGHLREYWHAARQTATLVRRLARSRHFDVVHACNPPDFLLLTALPLKRRGTRFVFDHHDLSPELYLTLYGDRSRLLHGATRALERASFGLADVVLSTNESYRRIALQRGGKRPEDVFVVRNAPSSTVFSPGPGDPARKRGAKYLLSYAGVMGRQDGVEDGLRALAALRRRRDDWRAVFVGDGPALPDALRLAEQLGIADVVEFPGWVAQEEVRAVLAASDVCLSPEPATPYSNASTLIKVGEYMAMARPVVCYDLDESRFTAGPAASYARPGDEDSFAGCISALLDDPPARAAMGAEGRERIEGELSVKHAEHALLEAYDRALGRRG
jgi:glycosyltransferase involved in cell wall biosynthesis